MSEPTEIHFFRQKHDAKRAGTHFDYRVVIGDKAFSWASRKEFPETGKPTLLWEQPVHHKSYLDNPNITIPDGQYGAGTQIIDYAQKGKADVYDDSYHLELNNGDRFLIKKAPEHYGEKAWLFLRKKKLEDKKNPYLEKTAKKNDSVITPGTEMLGGVAAISGAERGARNVRAKGSKELRAQHKGYMLEANKAGKPMSKSYMEKMVQGATKNVSMEKSLLRKTKAIRIGGGLVGAGLVAHGIARSVMDKKASENPYLEKMAALGDKDMISAKRKVNEHLERKGLPHVGNRDFKDEFKETRGVSRRLVGTLGGMGVGSALSGASGSPLPFLATMVGGYYLGKSMDNKKAGKTLVNQYLDKEAAEKKRDKIHGWRRAGTVLGTTQATTMAGGVASLGLLQKIKKQEKTHSPLTENHVKSYVKKKDLEHVNRVHADHFTEAHYNPNDSHFGKGPYVRGHSPEAILHEYGHAHSYNNAAKKVGKGFAKARFGSIIASQKSVMGIGGLAGAYAATSDNEKVRKYAPAAVAASTVPLLAEEARASLSPIKHLYKTEGKAAAKHLAKRLAPAFGTYVAGAAAAVGAASWAKHIKNKAVAKANKAE